MTGQRAAFQAFLSHKYEAPEINLYFFGIFHETADVQFEVDKGKGTSVTRLERAIRAADAFIGIYPLIAGSQENVEPAELRKQSRYFRLELDLAIRSGKPGLVFADERYGNLFVPSANIGVHGFDTRKIAGQGPSPVRETYARAFDGLLTRLGAERTSGRLGDRVGILLPGYEPADADALCERLEDRNCEVVRLRDPAHLGTRTVSELEPLDWALIDVGDEKTMVLASYLHHAFLPLLRFKRLPAPEPSPVEEYVYNLFEVGYRKDIIRWSSRDDLLRQFDQKLARINERASLFRTWEEAEEYFREAALRDEPVFVSYAGEDETRARAIADALKKRFKTVFDYRDERSLTPGGPWLAMVADSVESSLLGVPLLSDAYLNSDHCVQEAQLMIARKNDRKMRVIAVKLDEAELKLPGYLSTDQYIRGWKFSGPDAIAAEIVRALKAGAANPPPQPPPSPASSG